MKILVLALAMLASRAAFAQSFVVHVDDRPVLMRISGASESTTYDPTRDYDFEILTRSLNLLDECVDASVADVAREVVVPSWQALMGLSAQLGRFNLAAKVERHVNALEPSLAWYPAYLRHERSLITLGRTSFVDVFREREYFAPATPIDLRDLARRSVDALGASVNPDVIDWLAAELWTFPDGALRTPSSEVKYRAVVNQTRPCAVDLGDNVVLFKPKPR